MRRLRWILAVAVGSLGLTAGWAVGASGSSGSVRAAAEDSFAFGQLDRVLNDGTKAVLKALNQGLAIVLGSKSTTGAGAGFRQQQQGWNRVKNNYDAGATQFANAANQASDQFMNGVFSPSTSQASERSLDSGVFSDTALADQLIKLLRLISGYQQKVSKAAASWDQVKNSNNFDQSIASAASVGGTATVGSGLKGATQLIQTVAKAEVTLYEKVAVAEIEYEGGILDAQAATQQIDDALAAFEKAIEGGAKKLVKGSAMSWNQVVNKTITPVAQNWNQVANGKTMTVLSSIPVPAPATVTTTTSTTATTTVTQPQTPTTVTITCPTPPDGQFAFIFGDPITVTGSVSPPVGGATVTVTYGASPGNFSSTTDTDTTASDGTFTDTTAAPNTLSFAAQSIQATYGSANSNACAAAITGD